MDEISLREYCGQIENVIERGHYAEAVAHGKHILKQYPKHIATHQLLGKAMLEAGQGEYAADMFRRVLSADPEDMIAWVGMSEVHSNRSELDAAVWYLERAFEVASDSKALEEELRQLYSRRDGVEPRRTPLTPGALARLYLKGNLLSRAISELRALLAEHPERVELRVALAEALWRNEQRLEASEVCQRILDELSYCLKANLILGAIWTGGGREEGQMYLRRAEALDPENRMAQELFGVVSPLPARQAQVVPLEYGPPTGEERPEWMAERVLPTEEGAALVDIATGLEAQIEIPSWLEEVATDEEAELPALPSPIEPPEGAIPVPTEGIPAWLTGAGEGEEELVVGKPEAVVEEEAPDWLAGLGLEPIGDEEDEETPEWLAELGIEPTVEAEVEAAAIPREEREEKAQEWLAELGIEPAVEAEIPAVPREEEAPEWLAELDGKAASEEPVPFAPPAEQPPDWLAGIRDQLAEKVEKVPAPDESAPAIGEIVPTELPQAVEAPAPVAEEAPLPAWLEGDEMPSGDEALAWLERLTEGKEEELLAQATVEAEVRAAEIMGRPRPEAPSLEEAAPEIALGAVEGEPAPAMPAPAPAEVPEWIQELAPPEIALDTAEGAAAPEISLPTVEAAPAVEAPAPVAEEAPLPAWLEGDEMPSGDEALAWLERLTEGKEEELLAQATVEAEVRAAEIMGRPRPEAPPPKEAAPEIALSAVEGEPTPAMPVPAPAEVPEWIQELAPPELALDTAEGAAAPEIPLPTVEAAPAVEVPAPVAEEAPLPAWLEGDEMPSGDEALAWLERLTEGKEEELLAQATVEAEVRAAEIMGRPRPVEPPPEEAAPGIAPSAVEEEPAPAMPAPAPAEVPEWMQELAPPEIKAVPEEALAPPAGEAFGWTAFGEPEAVVAEDIPPAAVPEPAVEASATVAEEAPLPAWLEGEEMPSGDEALAWLERLTEGKEEELLAQATAEAEVRAAEIMGRPRPVEPPPEEAAPELAPSAVEGEPVPAMPAPAPAEVPEWIQKLAPPKGAPLVDFGELRQTVKDVPGVPEEIAVPPAEKVFGWTAFGEPEVIPQAAVAIEEIPPAPQVPEKIAPPKAPEWARVEEVEAPPVIEMPAIEEVPGVVEMEVAEPLEEAIAPPEIPTAEALVRPFAAERVYLKEHPRDYKAWLSLARALWQAGEREGALEAYSRVIRSGKLLESVIPDLEEYLEQQFDVRVQRALGDAYMKDGQLQKALGTYRQALEAL